jgi:acetyl esterase/lipase
MDSTAAATAIKAEGATPMTEAPKPPLTRLRLWLRLWSFKIFIRSLIGTLRFFKYKDMGKLQPTYRKTYPVGPRLTHDVWIPSSFKPGQTLPLYIDIHGGGFAIGDPFHDESWCHYLAEKQNVCVVSCDYRKSPGYFFPTQTQDLVQIVTSILNDDTLPVDKTNIAMGGFSAGGNLSLSVAQEPSLKAKLKGLVLWYPVTDFSGRYKGEMKNAPDESPDVLQRTSELFNYGYVAADADRGDPRLSPVYADRNTLPAKMLFIGAEHDVLCNEASVTANLYAKAEHAEIKHGDAEEDARQGIESWSAGGISWEKVLGAQHGFNYLKKKEPVAEAERERITLMAYDRAAAWLKREIYV